MAATIKPGMWVVNIKMQVLGKVERLVERNKRTQFQVMLSKELPSQTWNEEEVLPWDAEKEAEKLESNKW